MIFLTTNTHPTITNEDKPYNVSLRFNGKSSGYQIRNPSFTNNIPTTTINNVNLKYLISDFLTENTEITNAVSEINTPNSENAPGTTLGAKEKTAKTIAIHPNTY